MFKKIISLIVVISISLSIVGCQKRISAIESAEKHGYWHGFDGITWGMTIDECKSVLKLNDGEYQQSKMDELKYKDISETEALAFNTNLYGTPVVVALYFNDFAPISLGSEWLYSVQVNVVDPNELSYADTLKAIDAELEATGLSYQKENNDRMCSTSINKLQDSAIKEKATKLLKECYDGLPEADLEHKMKSPIDGIMILGTEETSFRSVSYKGTNAALVALAEQGRGL